MDKKPLSRQPGAWSLTQRRIGIKEQKRGLPDGGWQTVDDSMDIADWRRKIDEIDRKLVELISQRAEAVHQIGRVKAAAGLPVYEPDREKTVFENAHKANAGPLPDRDLFRIYERIIDVMRQSEMEEMAGAKRPVSDGLGDTEIDPEVND